jgi:hypothetical protein
MKTQYQYHLEQEYQDMRNLYLSMLDSGYWDSHSLEQKAFKERMRALYEKTLEAAE